MKNFHCFPSSQKKVRTRVFLTLSIIFHLSAKFIIILVDFWTNASFFYLICLSFLLQSRGKNKIIFTFFPKQVRFFLCWPGASPAHLALAPAAGEIHLSAELLFLVYMESIYRQRQHALRRTLMTGNEPSAIQQLYYSNTVGTEQKSGPSIVLQLYSCTRQTRSQGRAS